MKYGYNIISHNLKAFCLGGLGGFGVSIKHILLDGTGGVGWDFVSLLWVYGVKLIMTALTTAVSGIVSAWITDVLKKWWRYWKSKKNRSDRFSENGESKKDKAA